VLINECRAIFFLCTTRTELVSEILCGNKSDWR